LFGSCSLRGTIFGGNSIGEKGAQYIGDALKENKTLTVLECAPTSLPKVGSLCCLQGVLTVCGCSLFGPHSLGWNQIRNDGAQHIGKALKANTVLTTLRCAPGLVKMRLLCCQQGALTVCGCSLFGPRSLRDNNIGDEGAQHISEALKINKAITTLKCALAAPQLTNALALLSAGVADLVNAPCLALAALERTRSVQKAPSTPAMPSS
jgi:hypothetical protein